MGGLEIVLRVNMKSLRNDENVRGGDSPSRLAISSLSRLLSTKETDFWKDVTFKNESEPSKLTEAKGVKSLGEGGFINFRHQSAGRFPGKTSGRAEQFQRGLQT